MSGDGVYSEAAVMAKLAADLPEWTFEAGCIARTYRTSGWRATLMVVNAIGHLAELAWHHPDLEVHYSRVVVTLNTHDAGGITDKDFALARKIESVILWQPAVDGQGLDGIPADAPYVLSD